MKPIKTKEFIIRKYKASDAKSIYKNINNKKIYENTANIPWPYKLKDAENYIQKNLNRYRQKKPESINYVIEIDGEASGGIGLHEIKEGHKAKIGYWLAEKHWGKRLMTKIVRKILPYFFKKYKLVRIVGDIFSWNKGSGRVLEKNGFKLEGIHKKSYKKDGKYIDQIIYAKVK